jgi:predicted N-acetyltransferase YhbS
MKLRPLERHELDRIWSIDRAELTERVYRIEGGALALRDERHDVTGWPPGEPERYAPILRDCFERGGAFVGAFDGATLVGVAVLESRSIGRAGDTLQLAFLHVSRALRGSGVGRALFEASAARARSLGARRLYVSATPSENTVRFYLRRGCRLAAEPDPALFALEPEDIHLELQLSG